MCVLQDVDELRAQALGVYHPTRKTLAAIDPATPHRSPASSHAPSPFGTAPIARSNPPSTHRRSIITDQIYQFALGYPQTPPENSPLETTGDLPWDKPEIVTGAMGSFVFRWYVWRLFQCSMRR
ncbi:MAG: hypothetical protein Q9209_000526 [Squamulea sp. 1 TL-2023]